MPITLQVNKNQALRGKEAEKFYEDRDTPIDELKRCQPSRVSILCYFGSLGYGEGFAKQVAIDRIYISIHYSVH